MRPRRWRRRATASDTRRAAFASPAPTAKAALWVSVFGIFGLPIVVSVVLAIIALVQAQSLPGRVGAREAIAALAFNGILIVGAVIFYLIGLSGLF